MKAKTTTHAPARSKKKPAHPRAAEVVRNVDAISVAAIRLENAATLMALARILVAKTSEGINQAPGPIPMEKKDKYTARPTIATLDVEKAIKIRDAHMPV